MARPVARAGPTGMSVPLEDGGRLDRANRPGLGSRGRAPEEGHTGLHAPALESEADLSEPAQGGFRPGRDGPDAAGDGADADGKRPRGARPAKPENVRGRQGRDGGGRL